MILHNIAQLYPGVSPLALLGEDADFWLRHLAILREAGVLKEQTDG